VPARERKGITRNARGSPFRLLCRPDSSCSRMTRFRSRQASVIHGRSPASRSGEACSVGRKARPVLVLPDQDGVAGGRQRGGHRGERRNRVRRRAEIGQDPRRLWQRNRWHRVGPLHRNVEGTGRRDDLAAAVGPDPAAWSHHHVLRAGIGREKLLHRARISCGHGRPRGEWGRWGGCEDVTSGRVGVCGDRGLLHLGWPRR